MILATTAFNVIMTIVVIIITGFAIFGLIKLAYYNERKYKEEKNVLSATLITKNNFKQMANAYINHVGAFGSFAMMLFDIDDFSGLNETYGTERCDMILKTFAERISKVFEGHSIAARIGTDKIAVLYKSEAEYSNIDDIMSNAIDYVKETYVVGTGEEINLTCSVGVALYPTCGNNFKDLMQSLEIANYVAKRDGGNRYVVYNKDIKEEESSNLEYFKEVRRAFDNNEFCLYYQPIINLQERKVFGFESFLRWNHPKLGVLTPDKFIHVLEHSGDINYISKWGVEQLIKKIIELDQKTGNTEICMTHNLSTKQLMSDTLIDEMRKLLHKYKIDPKRIVLEVLEYAMYEKVEAIRLNLLRLRDLGFRISVDGLGLDYATLSQIEKEPIDILKLDKEFLEDINNNFIKEKFVEMLVASSIRLNRIVVSEGIEQANQVRYVLDNGIIYGQGYFFSKPFEDSLLSLYLTEGSYNRLIGSAFEGRVKDEDIKESKIEEIVEKKTDEKVEAKDEEAKAQDETSEEPKETVAKKPAARKTTTKKATVKDKNSNE